MSTAAATVVDSAKREASPRVSLVSRIASRYSVDPTKMMDTLKATAFRLDKGEISNEQMMALLIVADQYKLNPFTKEIYAFPDRNNGIVPVVGVDGWARIINEHPQFDGVEFVAGPVVEGKGKPCPESITCIIYRKDRGHPMKVTEYLDECFRAVGPWQSHTKRMLRHKALIQCARLAFGFVGIYDQDEAERIVQGEIVPDPDTGSQAERLNRSLAKPKSEDAPEDEPPAAEPEPGPSTEESNGAPFTVADIEKMLAEAPSAEALDEIETLIKDGYKRGTAHRQRLLDKLADARRRVDAKGGDA